MKSNGTSAAAAMVQMTFSHDAHPYLVKAARRRGISLSGYVRRAVMAHVALDLGIEATDLFELDTQIGTGTPNKLTRDLDGALYGRWEVQSREPGSEPR